MITKSRSRLVRSVLFQGAFVLFTALGACGQITGTKAKRAVTVADSIQMTGLLESDYRIGSSKGHVAKFSPDGKRFIVISQKGNLQNNTNEYALLLYQTPEVFRKPKPEVILTMTSSSNGPAVLNLKWLPDNETVAFLGENQGEVPQINTFNIRTKHLDRLTNHPTPITQYDVSSNGEVVVFDAPSPTEKIIGTAEARRNGIAVSIEDLPQILAGDCFHPPAYNSYQQLFVKLKENSESHAPVDDFIDSLIPISLSPSGRYAVLQGFVRNVPKIWERYRDPEIRKRAIEKPPKGSYANLLRYLLLDTKTAEVTPLLDTPRNSRVRATWAPDGNSVLLSGARLPIDIEDATEREEREKYVYVVEVFVPSREVLKIRHDTDNETLFQPRWEGTNRIFLERAFGRPDNPVPAAYERNGSLWKEAPVRLEDSKTVAPLNVVLEEDMNSPPKVYASDPEGKGKTLLLDLNPQFTDLDFGKIEKAIWNGTDGHEFSGGLFWPPDYISGNRYPLVIQTHGFNPSVFSMDGIPYPPAAARALASRGFFVLQVNGPNKDYADYQGNDPQEAPVQMAAYEGAIEWLDSRGLIDRDRVGLVGFSRTVYYVAYTLTHSKYYFAAGIMADGISGGYFPYLAFPFVEPDYEFLNGGSPYGRTAASWWENSPGFNLDKVHTPVRLETHGSFASVQILSEWEWFAGLSRLNKAVDLIYLPDGSHILVKPWERMVSQQGAVDWFCFWLKGEEDPDPAKAEQYKRWGELKKMQRENGAKAKAANEKPAPVN